jgi:hypothetical protein
LTWSIIACNTENTNINEPSDSSSSSSKYYSELPFNKDLLEEGDIILRRGSGILSSYIITKLNDSLPVSHCGIITKNKDQFYVIHSILSEEKGIKGVTKEPLDEFILDALLKSLVIVRQKQSAKYKLDFVNRAEAILNAQIPFDPLFDIQTKEKMYCTEIVWHISKELLKEDIFKEKVKAGNIELLRFNNFFNPTYFEVIYSDFE